MVLNLTFKYKYIQYLFYSESPTLELWLNGYHLQQKCIEVENNDMKIISKQLI